MKIDEKTKQELIEEVYFIIKDTYIHNRYDIRRMSANVVSCLLGKLNVDTVSEAEARSERN